jgi:hypothetical protein
MNYSEKQNFGVPRAEQDIPPHAKAWPSILDETPKARELVARFRGKLEELEGLEHLHPDLGVTLIANLNAHGAPIPVRLLDKMGEVGPDSEHAPLFREIRKSVRNRLIQIEPPLRGTVGRFPLQYNVLRGFRPNHLGTKGKKTKSGPSIFANPINDAQVFAKVGGEGQLEAELMFNRYPFAPYHFLWIPYRKAEGAFRRSQRLSVEGDRDLIEGMWDFVTDAGLGSAIRLGYNSEGAHASVPDFHAQGFWLTREWEPPIEKAIREGGAEDPKLDYFPQARWMPVSKGVEPLKEFVREMDKQSARSKDPVAYNLYMTPKGTMAFPRRGQGDPAYEEALRKSPFTMGFGFFEMAGEIICPDRKIFEEMLRTNDERPILKLFESLKID